MTGFLFFATMVATLAALVLHHQWRIAQDERDDAYHKIGLLTAALHESMDERKRLTAKLAEKEGEQC